MVLLSMCNTKKSFILVLVSSLYQGLIVLCWNCLTSSDPFTIVDIDDSPHQVTSSLSPLPEDVKSLPCMFLSYIYKVMNA